MKMMGLFGVEEDGFVWNSNGSLFVFFFFKWVSVSSFGGWVTKLVGWSIGLVTDVGWWLGVGGFRCAVAWAVVVWVWGVLACCGVGFGGGGGDGGFLAWCKVRFGWGGGFRRAMVTENAGGFWVEQELSLLISCNYAM
uniref:Transmembrane protein n=1 Tax=Fagus sylvatica TaxID=28930 RepID=A0A2N9FEY1_FAGSY